MLSFFKISISLFSKSLNSPQLNITLLTLKLCTKQFAFPIWSLSPCGDCQKVSRMQCFYL